MRTEGARTAVRAVGALFTLLALGGCGAEETRDERPSIVLVVLDTVRASAVSAYGEVDGTTPTFDALAQEGLLYRNAIAPSPWTLPSHATLLTGLGVDEHRVGMPGRTSLDEGVVTLAERLHEAGYETAAFSESMLVADAFHMLQGFEHRRTSHMATKSEGAPLDHFEKVEVLREVGNWLDRRDRTRPFFVFVNLLDAHDPYTVRDENPWVPAGTTRERMGRYADEPEFNLCRAVPPPEDVAVLRGLYRGDVRVTDDLMRRVLTRLRNRGGAKDLITVVTSDHGELFGDRGLLGHEFAVRPGVLQIPLVVHGLPGHAPAEIDVMVTLADLAPSLLAWAGLEVPPGLPGRILPTHPGEGDGAERGFLSAYTDGWPYSHPEWEGVLKLKDRDRSRTRCGPDDKVRGGMIALTRHPYRFYWFERYAPELYDLRWDEHERSDLAPQQPDLVAKLTAEIEPFARRAGLWDPAAAPLEAEPTREETESLRALGYLE